MTSLPRISVAAPSLDGNERDYVLECLDSTWISSAGRFITDFEKAFADYCGVKHAITCNNGTTALHLALVAMGVGPGDEVIIPSLTYIASCNAVTYCGATVVLVDNDPRTFNVDPALIEAKITPRTKAILGVEAFGNPVGMHEVAMLAARHEIPLVEDSCEGLGSAHKGRKVGTFGRCGVFGFYPNKQITTGEGGMIVTNDRTLADLCRSLRNQGRDPGGSWLSHARLGYNYRLSDMNAAMGVVQMRRLPEIVEARQRVAHEFISLLLDEPHLILPTIDDETVMSWFVFVVRLTGDAVTGDLGGAEGSDRDALLGYLRNHHIGCSNYFPPIHLQPFYMREHGFKRGDFPITEYVADRTIALPFHNRLTHMEIEAVAHHLREGIARRLEEKGR